MGGMSSKKRIKARNEKIDNAQILKDIGCTELYKAVQNCVDKEVNWITCMPEIHAFRASLREYAKKEMSKNKYLYSEKLFES